MPYQGRIMEVQHISRTFIQNANFGIIVVDSSFQIESLNQAASDILNICLNSVGTPLDQVLAEVAETGSEALLQALSDKISSQINVVISGKVKILEISASSLLDPKGAKEGTVFFICDVTGKENSGNTLQNDLNLATIGRLASEVAHELKNPVTVIKGFSQLLLKKQYEDEQVVDFLEIIYKEAERAHMFIQDFLNLGKTKKLHKKEINLSNLIADSVTEIEKQCFLNGIEIVQQIETSSKILGDYNQLKQALVNLGKNGVEAMELSDTPKRLTFVLTRDSITNKIYIKVIDAGNGIPPHLQGKIMAPFFTTKKYGTGLGLSITKTIVEQHGGRLILSSSPQGTTATIELPGQAVNQRAAH